MDLRYFTRPEGPAAFDGQRLGAVGILHAMQDGEHANDTLFELGLESNDKGAWTVVALFTPLLAGRPAGEHTLVVFGDAQHAEFTAFRPAYIFCDTLANQLQDKPVETSWMSNVVNGRAIHAALLVEAEEVAKDWEEIHKACDPNGPVGALTATVEDVTVGVDVPADRVLH